MTDLLAAFQQHPVLFIGALAVCLLAAVLIFKIVKKLIKVALILAIGVGVFILLWKFGVFAAFLG
jgi:hypothetical protein